MLDDLARTLRAARTMRGMSLAQTAAKAKISTAYVQKLERGEVASPSPHVLRALGGALEISYEELMRLAGYLEEEPAMASESRARILAEALAAEEPSAEEIEELGRYLRFRRAQQQEN